MVLEENKGVSCSDILKKNPVTLTMTYKLEYLLRVQHHLTPNGLVISEVHCIMNVIAIF
jgi:hypothetical protein